MLLAALATFIACEGPAGKDGINGTNGIDGIDGTDGTDGQDGNANVNSAVTTISAADWIFFDAGLSYIDFQVPIVTADIAASGLVMVYIQEASAEWYALPFSRGAQSFFFWAKPGLVRIHTENTNGSPYLFAGDIRIVAISADGLARNPNLDWTDYTRVKEALQLSE